MKKWVPSIGGKKVTVRKEKGVEKKNPRSSKVIIQREGFPVFSSSSSKVPAAGEKGNFADNGATELASGTINLNLIVSRELKKGRSLRAAADNVRLR